MARVTNVDRGSPTQNERWTFDDVHKCSRENDTFHQIGIGSGRQAAPASRRVGGRAIGASVAPVYILRQDVFTVPDLLGAGQTAG